MLFLPANRKIGKTWPKPPSLPSGRDSNAE
jgi:hypothetical protein